MVRINDTPYQIEKGEAKVVKLENKQIEWSCGPHGYFDKASCVEEAGYLIIIRYPEASKVSLHCDRSSAN